MKICRHDQGWGFTQQMLGLANAQRGVTVNEVTGRSIPGQSPIEQAEALNAVSRAIARLDRQDVLHPVLHAVQKIAPVDAVGIYVLSDDNASVERFSQISGHRQVVPGLGQVLPVEDSDLARLALNRESFIFDDLLHYRDQRLLDRTIAIQAGVRCAATVPIQQGSQISGAVVFDSRRPDEYDAGILPFFNDVAHLIGIYLENQSLLRQITDIARREAARNTRDLLTGQMHNLLTEALTELSDQIDGVLTEGMSRVHLQENLEKLHERLHYTLRRVSGATDGFDRVYPLGMSLEDALQGRLTEIERKHGVATRMGSFGISRELSAITRLTLFHFVGDVLTGIHLPAGARRVRMHLDWSEEALSIETEDDSNGLIKADGSKKASGELSILQQRAGALNGQLTLREAPGWGIRLTLTIPLQSEPLTITSRSVGPAPIQVLLLSSHRVFRSGIEALLSTETDIEVRTVSPEEWTVTQAIPSRRPDIVLIDLLALQQHGPQILKEIQTRIKPLRFIILGSSTEPPQIAQAARLGAWGYLDKDAEPEALVEAIRKTSRGEPILPPEATAHLLQSIHGDEFEELTERESEILGLVALGLRNRDIAGQLVVEESTVRWHMHNILQKLGARTRIDAVRIARDRGLLLN